MSKFLPLFILILLSSSCGKKEKLKLDKIKREKSHYKNIINTQTVSSEKDLRKNIYLINEEYPMEISLGPNGEFYYYLEKLGFGKGSWKYEGKNVKIETFAKQKFFDMKMKLYSMDLEGKKFSLEFTDRFGPKLIDMKIINQ